MLWLLSAVAFSAIPLPRDDAYHAVDIPKTGSVSFWVQPNPSASIIILTNEEIPEVSKRNVDETAFKAVSLQKIEHGDVKAREYSLSGHTPFEMRIENKANEDIHISIRHVHTDPVYRLSAVIGAFALFVCLFLFVFSWTLFCGACRATRKR